MLDRDKTTPPIANVGATDCAHSAGSGQAKGGEARDASFVVAPSAQLRASSATTYKDEKHGIRSARRMGNL